MVEQALEAALHHWQLFNEGRINEMNRVVADDFFAVFSLGQNRSYETYNAEQYRTGNIEAAKLYEGKNPHWVYRNLASGMRFDDEAILSSQIDFYLGDHLTMKAFCTEIYRKDRDDWKLIRQYMEKYQS